MLGLIGIELADGPDWPAVLHEGSLGCVGQLHTWLVDAEHAFQRRRGAATFEECVAEFRRSSGQLNKIRFELAAGIARLDLDRTGGEPTKPARAWAPPKTLNGQSLRPGEAKPKRSRSPIVAGVGQ
jgi:hypothetical protein